MSEEKYVLWSTSEKADLFIKLSSWSEHKDSADAVLMAVFLLWCLWFFFPNSSLLQSFKFSLYLLRKFKYFIFSKIKSLEVIQVFLVLLSFKNTNVFDLIFFV